MRIAKLIGCSVVAIIAGMGPGAHASLIGSTFNENITISGSDDHGAYTITAFSGAVTVPGPGNFTATDAVFKQLTQGGFATASNQLTGNVNLTVGANFISVNFTGQAQPFELESTFTGISGTILTDTDSTSGIGGGVSLDLFHNFTPSSLHFATFFEGFMPGTNATQTETLTFAAAPAGVPEPATLSLFGAMLAGFGWLRRRKRA